MSAVAHTGRDKALLLRLLIDTSISADYACAALKMLLHHSAPPDQLLLATLSVLEIRQDNYQCKQQKPQREQQIATASGTVFSVLSTEKRRVKHG